MAKVKSTHGQAPTQLGELVERLGPINNRCRTAEGIEKVELLWDLGDALLTIAPGANDQLLRKIHEHSYITRDILRYGLIIRRGWPSRLDLRKQLPRLSCYSLFREALPFLKGDRCGVDHDVHAQIVAQLNSGDPKKAKEFLKQLKGERIGRKHKKGQAIDRMSEPVEILRNGIRRLIDLATCEPAQLTQLAETIGHETIVRLSQACIAIADDDSVPEIPPVDDPCQSIADILLALMRVASANPDDRNGFRRAIGTVTLMELGDLLNAMRSKESLVQWQSRRQLKLTV